MPFISQDLWPCGRSHSLVWPSHGNPLKHQKNKILRLNATYVLELYDLAAYPTQPCGSLKVIPLNTKKVPRLSSNLALPLEPTKRKNLQAINMTFLSVLFPSNTPPHDSIAKDGITLSLNDPFTPWLRWKGPKSSLERKMGTNFLVHQAFTYKIVLYLWL